jgi:DNA-binding MarR family transcriptional regulator
MTFDFSKTYLYKMHRLTNSLDQAFDKALREHADITLSQFTLLLSVQHFGTTTNRAIATFLDISPAAVSRQVDIATKNGWVNLVQKDSDRRTQELRLTAAGRDKIQSGTDQLEKHVFDIFTHDNRQTNLMDHIVTLQKNIDSLEK